MRRLLAFVILASVKTAAHVFYRAKFSWPVGFDPSVILKVRLLVFLNHTSLYEPLFLRALPYQFLWYLAGHMNLPGADVTLNRPLVGLFWKLMVPGISTITRKRDESWEQFLSSIQPSDVVFIAPEGRMKRATGLDKEGQKMTVRGGVADIIDRMSAGKMLICMSGGLHHVQIPGQTIPKLFQMIEMNFDVVEINEFKRGMPLDPKLRKQHIMQYFQMRLEQHCPQCTTSGDYTNS